MNGATSIERPVVQPVHFLNQSDDPQLLQIYDLYEKMFPIDEERETLAGLRACLDCNKRKDLHDRFGGFEESWFYSKGQTGTVIGAINIFLCDLNGMNAQGAMHINYIFVNELQRKAGLATQLYQAAKDHAQSRWKSESFYSFCEQDLINQQSLSFFNHQGFSTLDFPFVQLALNDKAAPCRILHLRAKIPNNRTDVPSAVLLQYLQFFFSISVRKGQDIENDAEWQKMKNYLRQHVQISFKDKAI